MKKLITLALALMLALSLAACSGKDKNNNPSDSDNSKNNSSDSNNSSLSDSGNNSNNSSDGSNSSSSDSDNSNISSPAPKSVALTDTKIYLDLEEVQTNIPPQTVNDIVMVPVQAIMEKIGYDVVWIPEDHKLEVWEPSRQHPTIVLTSGSITAYYEKYVAELDERVSYEASLDVAPVLVNETLFAPLSFVLESTGYTVDLGVDSPDIYILSPEYTENQIGEGIGEDQPATDEFGEGVGETQPLSEDEKSYVISIRTESWLDLTQEKKEEVISLIARWWDIVDGYIVEDFDAMLADLDHQMETYFRNSVDEGILQTACDIYGLDANKYVQ